MKELMSTIYKPNLIKMGYDLFVMIRTNEEFIRGENRLEEISTEIFMSLEESINGNYF